MVRVEKRMEGSLGITGPQRLVLRVVSQRPGLSPGEVGRNVHLHPSTITAILQRLVKKGLLRRDRDSNDHRRIRLHTQAAARDFVAASTGTVESVVTHALARLPVYRVRHAREVLSAIASALGDNGGPLRGSTIEESVDADDLGRCRPSPIGRPGYVGLSQTEVRVRRSQTNPPTQGSVKCVEVSEPGLEMGSLLVPQLAQDLGARYYGADLPAVGELDPDIIIECTGATRVIADVITRSAPSGIVCLTGVSSGGHAISLDLGSVKSKHGA